MFFNFLFEICFLFNYPMSCMHLVTNKRDATTIYVSGSIKWGTEKMHYQAKKHAYEKL